MKPFDEYQWEVRTKESLDQLREELHADVRLLVQQEVRRAGVSEEVLQQWVSEQVREAAAQNRNLQPVSSRANTDSRKWLLKPPRLFPTAVPTAGSAAAWIELASSRHSIVVLLGVAVFTYFAGLASGIWLFRRPLPIDLPPVVIEQPSLPPPPDTVAVTP